MEKKKPRFKISLRDGFADRNNIEPINSEMQYNDLDERSRIKLLNEIIEFLEIVKIMILEQGSDIKKKYYGLIVDIMQNVYNLNFTLSDITSYSYHENFVDIIKETLMYDRYYNVFDFLEYFNSRFEKYFKYDLSENINKIFGIEFVGYRFVEFYIVEITNEDEIKEIEDALLVKDDMAFHLNKAIEKLSNRENPDYENSIKESILAVEVYTDKLTGEKTLGKALKVLEDKGIEINQQLKEAFIKLYAYTNSAKGVRHGGDRNSNGANFEEARFMLVTCSAFINYLKSKEIKI